jgi:copper chaperone
MGGDETTGRHTYVVPGMSCENCERAVRDELLGVPGVQSVAVDLVTKAVVVTGEALDDPALRAAIEDAGYEAA